MKTLTATYQGKTTQELINGKTYIIEIKNNSMMVFIGKVKIPYKNLYDFFNNWTNIIES